jgi:hypothetical protein
LAGTCRKLFRSAKVAWWKKNHQEYWDPRKVWMVQGVCHCQNKGNLLCKSGTAQGMHSWRTVGRTKMEESDQK